MLFWLSTPQDFLLKGVWKNIDLSGKFNYVGANKEARGRLVVLKVATDSPFTDYLDLEEMAKILNIHPQSLRRVIIAGSFPGPFKFNTRYICLRADFERFKSEYNPRPGRRTVARLL